MTKIINKRNLIILGLALLVALIVSLAVFTDRSEDPAPEEPVETEIDKLPEDPSETPEEAIEQPETRPETQTPARQPETAPAVEVEEPTAIVEEPVVVAEDPEVVKVEPGDNDPVDPLDPKETDDDPALTGYTPPEPIIEDIIPPEELVILPSHHIGDEFVILLEKEAVRQCHGRKCIDFVHTVHLAVKLPVPSTPLDMDADTTTGDDDPSDLATYDPRSDFQREVDKRVKKCTDNSPANGGNDHCTLADKQAIYDEVEAEFEAAHQPLFDKADEFANLYDWPDSEGSLVVYYYDSDHDDNYQLYVDNDEQYRILRYD